jgi:PKD repeat protein
VLFRSVAREGAAATVYNGRLWLTSGLNSSSGAFYADAWFLTAANESAGLWTRACDACTIYTFNHQMMTLGGKMWIIGGVGAGGDQLNTTDGITWTVAGASAMTNRFGAGLAVTSAGTAVLAGGYNTVSGLTNETDISTDGITWTAVNVTPAFPAANYLSIVNFTPPASALANPTRTFEGIYMVGGLPGNTATGSNLGWYSLPPPAASATPATTSGSAPFAVGWTDASTGYASTWAWDFRDGYFSYVQNASHIFTTAGNYGVVFTPSSPFGTSTITLNVIASSPQSQVQYYTQRQVSMRALDAVGVPLVGATITASYVASSLPSTNTLWLVSAFGISQQVANEMTNSSLAMSDLTGTDGTVTFMMFPALTYKILVTNATLGLSNAVYISPTDLSYDIYCPLATQRPQNQTYMTMRNTSLYVTEPDPNHVTFHLLYYDPSGLTTNLKYNVTCWDNQTPMYYVDLGNPGTAVVTDDSYTVPNVKGQEWRFFYNATRSVAI